MIYKNSSSTPANKNTLDKIAESAGAMTFNGVNVAQAGVTPSKWANKIWSVVGDSITEHNFRTTKNYQDYIAAKVTGLAVNNYGQSGTGWFTPNTAGNTNAFYQRTSAIDVNSDLITVFGGTNDWINGGKALVMGAFGDTNPAVSFYGAVDKTLSDLIVRFPTKTIAVFTPIPRETSHGDFGTNPQGFTLRQVSDAIIKVANHYAIPVLDLNRNASPLAPWNATNNLTYFSCTTSPNGDGLHPNDAGHMVIADKILNFLNDL